MKKFRYQRRADDYRTSYDVFDAETGTKLGIVQRHDDVSDGYWGRWSMGTGVKSSDGRPVRGISATRDEAVRKAVEIKQSRQGQEERRRERYAAEVAATTTEGLLDSLERIVAQKAAKPTYAAEEERDMVRVIRTEILNRVNS